MYSQKTPLLYKNPLLSSSATTIELQPHMIIVKPQNNNVGLFDRVHAMLSRLSNRINNDKCLQALIVVFIIVMLSVIVIIKAIHK